LEEVFPQVISKYEKVGVNFGYVKPLQDPYYEEYLKTKMDRSTKTQQWLAGRLLEIQKQQEQQRQGANNNSATKPSTSSNETKSEDEKKGENPN
jgi:hypothetical protein